jgi:hypothetical protein
MIIMGYNAHGLLPVIYGNSSFETIKKKSRPNLPATSYVKGLAH